MEKAEFTIDHSIQIEDYNIAELSFYFTPMSLPANLNLESIRVKDKYVALYSELDMKSQKSKSDSVKQTQINKILNTVIFEWSRYSDGQELFKNTIEQQELKVLENNSDVYYSDVSWPDEPETILAKQYFWVQVGVR